MMSVKRGLGIWLSVLALTSPAVASANSIKCEISTNNETAFGTFAVLDGIRELGNGQCGQDTVQAPPGKYTVVVKLDGALDGPEQRVPVEVDKGKPTVVKADFAMGSLTVQIQREGRRAAGVAIVRRSGKQVGTLGSGVAAQLSVGSYEVVVRYRDQEKVFADVKIEAGKAQSLEASF